MNGLRVRKTQGSAWTEHYFGPDGSTDAEYTAGGWARGYVYLGGRQIAEYGNGTTYFIHPDHLGSTRLMTNLNQSVYGSFDFLPFGEQIVGGSGTTHKFTGDERDSESNLDTTWFRQYSSTLGRWMHPDPAGLAAVDPSNPQSWNRYAYVLNNPLALVDPTGMDDCAHTSGDCGGITLDGEPINTYGSWFGRSLFGYITNGNGTAQCQTSDCTLTRIVQGGGGADVIQQLTWNDPVWTETWGPDGSLTSLSLQIGYFSWKATGYTDNTQVGWSGGFFSNARGNSSWAWTFTKTFVSNFQLLPSSLRLPGESFAACVDRTQKALLGNTGQSVLNGATGVSTVASLFTQPLGTTGVLAGAGTSTGTNVINTVIKTVPDPGTSVVGRLAQVGLNSGATDASTAAQMTRGAGFLGKAAGVITAIGLGIEGGFAISCR